MKQIFIFLCIFSSFAHAKTIYIGDASGIKYIREADPQRKLWDFADSFFASANIDSSKFSLALKTATGYRYPDSEDALEKLGTDAGAPIVLYLRPKSPSSETEPVIEEERVVQNKPSIQKYPELKWQSSLTNTVLATLVAELDKKKQEVSISITEEGKKKTRLTAEESSKLSDLRKMRRERATKRGEALAQLNAKIDETAQKLNDTSKDLLQATTNRTHLLAKLVQVQTALQKAEALRIAIDAFEILSTQMSKDELRERYLNTLIPLKNAFFSALMSALYGTHAETRVAIEKAAE